MPCHASLLTCRSDSEPGKTPPATGLKLVSGAAVEGGTPLKACVTVTLRHNYKRQRSYSSHKQLSDRMHSHCLVEGYTRLSS